MSIIMYFSRKNIRMIRFVNFGLFDVFNQIFLMGVATCHHWRKKKKVIIILQK